MSVELALDFVGTFLYDHFHASLSFAGKEATARPVDEAKLLKYALLDRFKDFFAHAEIG